MQNPYRLIFDVDGPNVAMKSIPGMDDAVDLSTTSLRSVSPVHLQYLRNMQVSSSASFSIRVIGKLWGLVALHATEPTTIPVQNRKLIRQKIDEFEGALRNLQITEEHLRFNQSAMIMEELIMGLLDCYNQDCRQLNLYENIETMIHSDNLVILVKGEVVYCKEQIDPDHLKQLCACTRRRILWPVRGQFIAEPSATGRYVSTGGQRVIVRKLGPTGSGCSCPS